MHGEEISSPVKRKTSRGPCADPPKPPPPHLLHLAVRSSRQLASRRGPRNAAKPAETGGEHLAHPRHHRPRPLGKVRCQPIGRVVDRQHVVPDTARHLDHPETGAGIRGRVVVQVAPAERLHHRRRPRVCRKLLAHARHLRRELRDRLARGGLIRRAHLHRRPAGSPRRAHFPDWPARWRQRQRGEDDRQHRDDRNPQQESTKVHVCFTPALLLEKGAICFSCSTKHCFCRPNSRDTRSPRLWRQRSSHACRPEEQGQEDAQAAR